MEKVLYAMAGTGFTFLMTAMGASVVFFFRGNINNGIQRLFLGFASGVMLAASVWSLLIPSMEEAKALGMPECGPATVGFICGGIFLTILDRILPVIGAGKLTQLHSFHDRKQNMLLVSAVTLHNIPEGMAVGLAFSLAVKENMNIAMLTSAMALALGIGIQNFPEGAAISLPLKNSGMKNSKAFFYGMISGIVEPIFGVIAVLIADNVIFAMPWLLAFAAGAMVYVTVDELIPKAHLGEKSKLGTIGVMAGFLIMMILDVILG